MIASPRVVRWLTWTSLGAFAALWWARWQSFPLALDPAYHLLVAQQVVAADGPIAYEWWEYAPFGRPHLYPPVLHLVLAALIKITGSPLTAIRLVSALLGPSVLLSLALVMRRLFTPALALACLWAGMLPFSFHLQTAVALAAAVGLIEFLWLIDAVEHRRPLAVGLLIALLFYTHLGLPWIALVVLGCTVIFRRELRSVVLKASWGLLVVLPWGWHLLRHRGWLHSFPRHENAMAELIPLLCAVALVGMWRCWTHRGRFIWLLACWVGFALLAPRHTYRWLSGEGLLPVILLAGIGIDWVSQRRRLMGAALVLLLMLSPTAARSSGEWRWLWADSSPFHLVDAPRVASRDLEAGAVSAPMRELAVVVMAHTQPREILWANVLHAGGMVAALTGRPTASAMLTEVSPLEAVDPLSAAQVVIWFKGDSQPPTERTTLASLPLRRVAETDIAVVFRREGPLRRAERPRAVLPLGMAWLLLGAAVCGVIWDLSRRGPPIPV